VPWRLKAPRQRAPVGVERAIELIEEAHRERQRVLELDHRIEGMRKNIDRFAAQVADVVVAAAPDLGRRACEAAAQELRRRLDARREVLARRDPLLRQQKTDPAVTEADTRRSSPQSLPRADPRSNPVRCGG
jgi:hypothetical protein